MTRPGSRLEDYLHLRRELTGKGWFAGADAVLANTLREALVELAGTIPAGHAVVAVGALGRGSVALHSDVDVLVLHRGEANRDLIRRLFRPLWDAGLRVGHAVRTPKECGRLARTRLDVLCSHLTAFLLAGEEELVAELERWMRRSAKSARSALIEEERARFRAEPHRWMARDLKRGRGGLRSLDLVDWLARLDGFEDDDPDLRSELQGLRSALHYAAGRAHDTYDFDLRERAAGWMGTDVPSMGRRILEVARRVEERVFERRLFEVGPPPAALLDVLSDPKSAWASVHSGELEARLPELAALVDVPHVVPFHRHAVFDHTLACLEEMNRLVGESGGLVSVALGGISSVDLARWSAVAHDLGKAARQEGHPAAGAGAARSLAKRVGLGDEEAEILERLTELHLFLADLATRFDMDDPAVREWATDRIDRPEILHHLYLLTVADSRATGTWTPWRAELIDSVYRRLLAEFDRVSSPRDVVEAVLEADADLSATEVVRHLAGFAMSYRTSHEPALIARHVEMARDPVGPDGVRVWVEPGRGTTRLVVFTHDRPGLLAMLTGVLALHGISIVDARLATRTDGRVFDTFEVVDARTGAAPVGIERVENDLARVLRGGFDLERALGERRRAYRATEVVGVEPRVEIFRFEGGGRVEVECADRVGLLHDLAAVFARFGMPVTRAKVDTRGGVAYDTFWVQRMPVQSERLEEALTSVM